MEMGEGQRAQEVEGTVWTSAQGCLCLACLFRGEWRVALLLDGNSCESKSLRALGSTLNHQAVPPSLLLLSCLPQSPPHLLIRFQC